MKVSVIIPVFNSENNIGETIKCVLNQSWHDKEIVIVDDGSTDSSLSIVRSFESENVKVYTQANRGAACARNLAFKHSTGDYIQYLDADDLLSPDKIEKQMQIAGNTNFDPGVLIFGKTAFIVNEITDAILSDQPVNKSYNETNQLLTDLFSSVSFISSHAYLSNRDLIIRSGGWDENLTSNDDGEFFARVISHSSNVIFCEDGISYYRRNSSNSLSKQKSPEHTLSEFNSLKIITGYILAKSNTPDSRAACSKIFNWFIVEWYPENKFILKQVESTMKQYGLSYYSSSRSRIYRYLQLLGGWRRALLFSEFYSGYKKQLIG